LLRHIQLLCLAGVVWTAGCGATSKTSVPDPPKPPAVAVKVAVMPPSANVRAGAPQQFMASVTGTSNTAVSWSVNGVAGGNAGAGIINSAGQYIAPQTLPNPNTVMVAATSAADTTAKGSATATLLNPTPILNNISPSTINGGNFTLTITGSNFVNGAKVALAGVPLATTFVNATQLTATGSQATSGSYAVTVSNPNPGASSSSGVNLTVNGSTQASACSGMSLGTGASLNGFVPFPANNLWNENISGAVVDPNSSAIINFIGGTIGMHADFGSGLFSGSSIGIPYAVVGAGQAPVNVTFNAYGDESDPGPMPIPANAQIEGTPNPGDQHVLVLDNSNCWLYELFGASVNGNGTWNAASASVWDLQNYNQRPLTWTSADAAGLPIFPGLARYDEVASGAIKHALRFTLQHSRAAYVLPATHWAANSTNANAAPMGMRLRLKANFNMSPYSAANQVILKALQQYGMIMADNGSSMFLSGAPDSHWDNNDLHALGNVKASDFEVVKIDTIYTSSNVPQGQAPGIQSFSASPGGAVSAGTAVTLSWSATNASYFIVSPQVGAVRGASANVTPAVTTTYTLYATNEFGRTTATVTVTVQ
jgi:IPT/TIG domain